MGNLLDILRKENNIKEKQLSKENNLLMTDMILYLKSSDLCEYDIEVIRRELFGMVYEAQLRGDHMSQVIGDDYKEFCEALMDNGRQKTVYEKFLEGAYIAVVGGGMLFLMEVLFSGAFLHPFRSGIFTMDITLGFLTSTAIILVAALAIYWLFTKHAFELSGEGALKYKMIFIAGFTVFFSGSILIKMFLGKQILFQLNFLYPATFLVLAYLTIKILGDRNADRLARTHK